MAAEVFEALIYMYVRVFARLSVFLFPDSSRTPHFAIFPLHPLPFSVLSMGLHITALRATARDITLSSAPLVLSPL